MTYSTPGGYGGPPQGPNTPGYGPQPQGYAAVPGQGEGKGLPFYFNIGVIALGVVSFLLGFTPYTSGATANYGTESVTVSASSNFFQNLGAVSLCLLLVAALVVALGMLPKQETHDGVVASLSAVGFISLLFQLISLPSGLNIGFGMIIVLVTSFLQAALAVAALLFASDIIKPPAPKQPQYGYYGQPGPYGQPQQQPVQQNPPQQPYYGGAPGPAPYQQQPPPSQPQQPHSQW